MDPFSRHTPASDQGLVRRSAQWMRSHLYTLAAVALLAGLAIPFLRKTDSQFDNVYVRAADHLLTGEDLYRLEDGYLYPPFMAWLSIPFAWAPQTAARVAWYLINVACLVLLWRWAWGLSGGGRLQGLPAVPKAQHVICLLGLACSLRFAIDCLQNQQCDLVIAALLLGGCVLWVRETGSGGLRTSFAGLLPATLWGVAAGMKCTPLLFAPYLLWRGKWPAAAWLCLAALGVNLLPDLVSGPERGGWWLGVWVDRYLLHMGRSEVHVGVWGSAALLNQSIAGAAYRFFVTDWSWTSERFEVVARSDALSPVLLKRFVYVFQAAMLACATWTLGRPGQINSADRPQKPALECSLVLLLMVLLSPMSSKPHFATLVLPAFLLAREAVLNRKRVAAAVLLATILAGVFSTKDLTGRDLASLTMWYGGVSACAFALLLGCGWELMTQGRRAAKEDLEYSERFSSDAAAA